MIDPTVGNGEEAGTTSTMTGGLGGSDFRWHDWTRFHRGGGMTRSWL